MTKTSLLIHLFISLLDKYRVPDVLPGSGMPITSKARFSRETITHVLSQLCEVSI
jgi:hypothetical protein